MQYHFGETVFPPSHLSKIRPQWISLTRPTGEGSGSDSRSKASNNAAIVYRLGLRVFIPARGVRFSLAVPNILPHDTDSVK